MEGRLTKFLGKGYWVAWVLEACIYIAVISINSVIYLATCYPLGNLSTFEHYFNIFFFPALAIELLAVWLAFHLVKSLLVIRDIQIDGYIGNCKTSQARLAQDVEKWASCQTQGDGKLPNITTVGEKHGD